MKEGKKKQVTSSITGDLLKKPMDESIALALPKWIVAGQTAYRRGDVSLYLTELSLFTSRTIYNHHKAH